MNVASSIRQIMLVLFLFALPLLSNAHIPNQSYIFIRLYETENIQGRFEINTRELNKIYGADFSNGIVLNDVQPYIEQLKAYYLNHVSFSSERGSHKIIFKDAGIFAFNLGDFVQLYFELDNTLKQPKSLTVNYNAVFDKDNTHTGYLITEYSWRDGVINEEANISLDFDPKNTTKTLDLTKSSIWNGFNAMIKQGVWHIWIGLDHILFLLALILPSVVRRKPSSIKANTFSWEPVKTFKSAFLYILKVVTFFTIAHTITLTLASLKLVELPSQLVESVIALSIGLAAYHNINPIFKMKDWVIAFIFGLFHGFGFASVLGDLGLTNEFLTLSLLGFNLGVEIGQIVIIAAIFPILFLIRNLKLYPKLLVLLSVLLIIISLYWFIERAFDIDLPIDDFIRREGYQFAVWLGLK